jgi:hypothetical protein
MLQALTAIRERTSLFTGLEIYTFLTPGTAIKTPNVYGVSTIVNLNTFSNTVVIGAECLD